ncbi:hypothetical protein [Natronolimnohabitans innermongolicus]|uniref:hypothetical protein n=1 Tax=Natronolimnohabitans innermongolicus TaxID=253107 RepID=UPI0012695FF9|nr:hypothetical protein [Natronolimnohabitans innermongolicus]
MSDDDTAMSVLSLAVSGIHPLVGTTLSAGNLLSNFAGYVSTCSGICDEWRPDIPQDELAVYRVYRRQIPEYTAETVEFNNIASGNSERVAITDLSARVSVTGEP